MKGVSLSSKRFFLRWRGAIRNPCVCLYGYFLSLIIWLITDDDDDHHLSQKYDGEDDGEDKEDEW